MAQDSETEASSIVYNACPNLREGSLNQPKKYVGAWIMIYSLCSVCKLSVSKKKGLYDIFSTN